MSRRKKNNNNESLPEKTGYIPLFSPDFKEDLCWWYQHDAKKGDKIIDLIADILDGNPFAGIGKPEPLKYIAPNSQGVLI